MESASDEKARKKAEKRKKKALQALTLADGDQAAIAASKALKKSAKKEKTKNMTKTTEEKEENDDDKRSGKKTKKKKTKKKNADDLDTCEGAKGEEVEMPRKRPRTRSMDAAEKKLAQANDDPLDFFADLDSNPTPSHKKAKQEDNGRQPSAPRDASLGDAAKGAALETPSEYKAAHSITIIGFSAGGSEEPDPVRRFEDIPFAKMAAPLAKAGFLAPSPIQAVSWPIACGSASEDRRPRDLIAVAKTGSGKTLGFLLPAFKHLADVRPKAMRGDLPRVLCLAPTRELAVQIHDESVKFGRGPCGVRTVVCFGGAPKSQQIRQIMAGVDVLVATPGRLNDLLEMRKADVSQVSFLVFDEADRMLDMGFEPQIREILKHVPQHGQGRRQTMFFTATWPKKVQALAATFLDRPVQVNIGSTTQLTASKSITQKVHVIEGHEKWGLLEDILNKVPPTSKVLVFSATKRGCNEVSDELWKKGVTVDCIHGDKEQWERTRVLDSFKRGSISVLVATDVAARGLDVPNVSHVINYDFPAGTDAVEDYVHRIGRTGRGNNTGEAITFFTRKDSRAARELEGIMKQAEQFVPPELQAMAQKAGKGGKPRWGGGFRGGRGGKGGGGGRGGKGRSMGYGGGGGFRKKW